MGSKRKPPFNPKLLGLNLKDRVRIAEIGFRSWLRETAEKQRQRMKKR